MDLDSKIIVYINGACEASYGMGAYVAILTFIDSNKRYHEKILSCGYKNTTSNRMEIRAAIEAFSAIKKTSNVVVYSDNKYLINTVNHWLEKWEVKNWKGSTKKPLKNIDLWKKLASVIKLHNYEFIWGKDEKYNNKMNDIVCQIYKSKNLKDDIQENDIHSSTLTP